MAGHSTEIFVEVPNKRFICPLCMDVLRDPVQCFDGHLFCRSCVSTSISVKQECPTCRKHLEPGKLAANIAVREMIDEMDVKCCSSPKCQWVGKLPDRETHISKDCDFFGVSCTLEGCSEMVPRVELQNHLQQCDFRLISCKHCAESFPFCQLRDHSLVCLQRPVECPNGCESADIKCCDLENHLASTCPMQVIPCMYFQHNTCTPDCCGTVLRKDLRTHLQMKRCMFLNMDVICRKVVVSAEDQDSQNSKLAVLELKAFLRKAGVIGKTEDKRDDSGYIGGSAALEVNRECPTCKTSLKVEKLTINLGMKNLIEEMLVVKCCNEADDDEMCLPCNWVGSLEQCSDHFASCDQRQVPCPLHVVGMCFNAECSGKVRRNNLSRHILSDKKNSDLADLIVILAKTVDSQAKEIKKLHDICVNEKSVRDVVMDDEDETKIDEVSFGPQDDDDNLEGDCILKSAVDDGYDIAVGSYLENSMNGWGARYSSDSTYYGDWKNGDMHGYGLYRYYGNETHYVYHGMFKNNKSDGFGEYHKLQTGVKYIGYFKNHAKHGKGVLTLADGSVFTGEWADDITVEPGTMRLPNGSVFIGTIDDSWEIKCGKLTSHDGAIYMGDFNPTDNTYFNGCGTITYLNGSVYTGAFLNCLRHGIGKYVRVGGEVVQWGDWDKDVFTCIDYDPEAENDVNPYTIMADWAVIAALGAAKVIAKVDVVDV